MSGADLGQLEKSRDTANLLGNGLLQRILALESLDRLHSDDAIGQRLRSIKPRHYADL